MDKKYFCYWIIIMTIAIIVITNSTNSNDVNNKLYHDDIIRFTEGWTYEDNLIILDESHIKLDPNESYTLENIVPSDFSEQYFLLLRSSLADVAVSVNGNLIYKQALENKGLLKMPYASLWHMVPMPKDSKGNDISITFKSPYSKMNGLLNPIYYGNKGDLILFLISGFGLPFIIDCIILLLGGVLLLISFINPYETYRSMMYIGLLAIGIALWLIAESRMLQLFTGSQLIIGSLAYVSLSLTPIPMIEYIKTQLSKKNAKPLNIASKACWIIFIVINGLQFFDIRDYYETIWLTHINILLTILLILHQLYIETKENNNKLARYNLISIIVLFMFISIELFTFNFVSALKTTILTRIGILGFIILLSTGVVRQFFKRLKISYKAEFYKKLAYIDPLIQGPNRTAFEHDIETLFNERKKLKDLRLVILDLNKLKLINDTFGHVVGDDAIRAAYSIINKLFSPIGKTYRIGGDEFACLLFNNDDCPYSKISQAFDKAIQDEDIKKEYSFSIAYGSVTYDRTIDETTEKFIRRADAKMYQSKDKIIA